MENEVYLVFERGDYNMQNKRRVNVDEGVNNQDAVNKHQLDVGLQLKPNTNTVILRDGTHNMISDLDLNNNNNRIKKIKNPQSGGNDAMGYKFFEDNFFVSMYNDINAMGKNIFNICSNTNRDQIINKAFVEDYYLKRDGSFSMVELLI